MPLVVGNAVGSKVGLNDSDGTAVGFGEGEVVDKGSDDGAIVVTTNGLLVGDKDGSNVLSIYVGACV